MVDDIGKREKKRFDYRLKGTLVYAGNPKTPSFGTQQCCGSVPELR
jgi:hypothetical protein